MRLGYYRDCTLWSFPGRPQFGARLFGLLADEFMDPAMTVQAVREWLVEGRLELVFRLWNQLVEDGWRPEPDKDLIAELDRRLAAHEGDPTNVRPWEQVLQRVRKRQ
jgi:putative addiction module component (TIGR02574 family)